MPTTWPRLKTNYVACRNACASALLQFLLDYPVGERRLQQHLQFLITNLGYEHEAGRASAIELLQASQFCLHLAALICTAPAASRGAAPGPRWLVLKLWCTQKPALFQRPASGASN